MGKARDLTNMRFDRLVARYPTEKRDGSGSVMWFCECDCGNTSLVAACNLTTLAIRSCGCKRNEQTAQLRAKDLTGMTFTWLRVVRKTEQRNPGVVWECECRCGNTVFVSTRSLMSGNTTSCGCRNPIVARNLAKKRAAADAADHTRLSFLNDTIFSNNQSGTRGVSLRKPSGKWLASINFRRQRYYLGTYTKKEDAIRARRLAEELLWKPVLEEYIGTYDTEEERKTKLKQYIEAKLTEN